MNAPDSPSPLTEVCNNCEGELTRARFLTRAAVGAGALVAGGDALLQALQSALPAFAAGGPSISSTMPIVSAQGLFLGSVKSLLPNKALIYKDPKTGDPALVIRLAGGKLVSYDAVCPHRGCTVTYDPSQRNVVCPCHGARFDPARQAAPIAGPVSQPLIALPIRVDTAGNVYALDAKPGSRVNRLSAAPPPSAGDDGGNGQDDGGRRRSRHRGGD